MEGNNYKMDTCILYGWIYYIIPILFNLFSIHFVFDFSFQFLISTSLPDWQTHKIVTPQHALLICFLTIPLSGKVHSVGESNLRHQA